MRLAYEVRSSQFGMHTGRTNHLLQLGFANAALFSRKRHLHFLSLDGIWFERPVSIGSILRLTSHVTHTTSSDAFPAVVVSPDRTVCILLTRVGYSHEPNFLKHVSVQANVVDVATGSEQHTNEFKFTWGEQQGEPLRRMVVPQTYAGTLASCRPATNCFVND